MALTDFTAAVAAVLRRRPADLLPMYVLGIAIGAIVRVVPFFAIAVAYLFLATTGRLESIRTQLAELESPPDTNDPEAFEAWTNDFFAIVDQLLTPPLDVLAAVTILVTVLLVAILSAAVAAGKLAACYSRLRNNRGLVAGLDGAGRYWLRFLALFVLEVVCWIAVFVVGLGTAVVAAGSLAAGSTAVSPLAGLLPAVVTVVLLAAVRALFAFAPVAIVVDDAGVFESVRNAAGFIRARPFGAAVYYITAIVTAVAITIAVVLISLTNAVTVTQFVPLLAALVVVPALDLLKTALYCDHRGRLAPPEPPARSLRNQAQAGLRRGWAEMISFVRETPKTHALVVGLALLGFGAGWAAAGPFVGTFETSIASRLEDHFPPAAALGFFGNNWQVALTTTYAGIAFAIPALVSLLFNGVFLGAMARLEVDPTELAAFIIPHGIFEIPAILIASALGISIGATAWRTWRGPTGWTALADELERAFWVLVGIGMLLAVAALLEGFVSPYYYRLLLT